MPLKIRTARYLAAENRMFFDRIPTERRRDARAREGLHKKTGRTFRSLFPDIFSPATIRISSENYKKEISPSPPLFSWRISKCTFSRGGPLKAPLLKLLSFLLQKISPPCPWGTFPLPFGIVSIPVMSTSTRRIRGIRITRSTITGQYYRSLLFSNFFFYLSFSLYLSVYLFSVLRKRYSSSFSSPFYINGIASFFSPRFLIDILYNVVRRNIGAVSTSHWSSIARIE